jgi:hypothetical protein
MDAARCPSFAADQDEGPQRGSGRPIPPLVSKIQAATTNARARAQGGLTPDFLALSNLQMLTDDLTTEFVDWEIKATLDDEDGLIAIVLPDVLPGPNGHCILPNRLQDNIYCRYAVWDLWEDLIRGGPARLATLIERAIAARRSQIDDSRVMMSRNSTPPPPRLVL